MLKTSSLRSRAPLGSHGIEPAVLRASFCLARASSIGSRQALGLPYSASIRPKTRGPYLANSHRCPQVMQTILDLEPNRVR